MARVNAKQYAEKWGRRLSGATDDIRRGVERVTESPMEKAADKQQKMITRLQEKVNDGTWARRLRAVSLSEWKERFLDKGIGRIQGGVAAAQSKMEAFGSQLLPHVDAGRDRIKGMPDITIEDNIQRMVEFTRHMATFKRE